MLKYVKRTVALALIVAIAPVAPSAAVAANEPFFMFSTSKAGDDVLQVVAQEARPSDYVSSGVVAALPQLAQTIPKNHIYALQTSASAASRGCAGAAGLVLYDGEHWAATPPGDQANMALAISRARARVKQTVCGYGIVPDGEFAGLRPRECSADLDRAIHRSVDWRDIALFDIQAQRLLSTACQRQGGLDAYVSFVTSVANEVRAKNPQTIVSAQFSFRYTAPAVMLEAMRRLRGVVDGFYFAYPSEQGNCRFCAPENLATVLRAVHSPG